jgi:cysteine synthase A
MTAQIADSILDTVGSTPLIRLGRLSPETGAEVLGKLESRNPGGSVKDRPALSMILHAEKSGALKPGVSVLVEATSGNTGISLAMIAAVRGYRCIIVLPEDMSQARRYLLRAYGAEVIVTPAEQGMQGAVTRAQQILKDTKHAFMTRQFENEANPMAHESSTAEEIWDATQGRLDAFVAGVGTGGTLTGVARALKKRHPALRVIAVEPKGSAVLSGGQPGLHAIQGLGAGFVPPIVQRNLIDDVIAVSDLAAERMAVRLAREEGILVGPSAGANVHASIELAATMQRGTRVVTILCDTGERYLV